MAVHYDFLLTKRKKTTDDCQPESEVTRRGNMTQPFTGTISSTEPAPKRRRLKNGVLTALVISAHDPEKDILGKSVKVLIIVVNNTSILDSSYCQSPNTTYKF